MKKILFILSLFVSLASFGQDTLITKGGKKLLPVATIFSSPTFTGTVTMPTPFTLGATSVTSTGTQLNYLNAASGTTGTTSTNLVYSASPVFTTQITTPIVYGGSASGDSVFINPTSNATKGNVYLQSGLAKAANAGGVWIGSSIANPLPTSTDTNPHEFGIINDSTNMQMFSMWSFGVGNTFQNNMHFYRSGGTIAAPRAILDGANILSMGFRGYDGTNMSSSAAAHQLIAEGNWTTSNHGLKYSWATTPTGSTTRAQAMTLFGTGDLLVGTGTTDNGAKLEVSAGTFADTKNAFKFSATFPTSPGNGNNAVQWDITGAGSQSFNQTGFRLNLLAGYTGATATNGFTVVNSSAGTSTFTITGGGGNIGGQIQATPTTTGNNLGIIGIAAGGNLNIGAYARANGIKNSSVNIGILANGRSSATSGIGIAGYFTQDTAALVTSTATTVYIDNGNQANPLMIIKDNGTEKIRVADGGNLLLNTTTDNSTLTVNGSSAFGYVAKTGTYTATAADDLINCTSGTFTVTLPTAVGCAGREYWVTNPGSGTITIGTTSSQTFTNVTATPTTLTLAQFTNYRVVSDGANWLAFKIVN